MTPHGISTNYDDALHWENICGYDSIFGDGTKISLTLCGPCLNSILGDIIIKEESIL